MSVSILSKLETVNVGGKWYNVFKDIPKSKSIDLDKFNVQPNLSYSKVVKGVEGLPQRQTKSDKALNRLIEIFSRVQESIAPEVKIVVPEEDDISLPYMPKKALKKKRVIPRMTKQNFPLIGEKFPSKVLEVDLISLPYMPKKPIKEVSIVKVGEIDVEVKFPCKVGKHVKQNLRCKVKLALEAARCNWNTPVKVYRVPIVRDIAKIRLYRHFCKLIEKVRFNYKIHHSEKVIPVFREDLSLDYIYEMGFETLGYIPTPVSKKKCRRASKKGIRQRRKLRWLSEMDDAPTGSLAPPMQSKQGSVVIESHTLDSQASPESAGVNLNYDGGEHLKDYDSLCDRWMLIEHLEWTSKADVGTSIKSYNLPKDAVSANKSQPNAIPFQQYRYWSGDMEIKIVLNSSKFQVGQLQTSWYYCDKEDAMYTKLRNNVVAASQRDHVLTSAGSSNNGSLYIPYRHYLTQINTKVPDASQIQYNCQLGILDIKVLNKLTVATGQQEKCSFSVYIRFPNSSFSGLINRTLDDSSLQSLSLTSDMFSLNNFLNTARTFLNGASADGNRDNPPDPKPASYVTPVAAHSLCAMTGTSEPINPLRMDLRGQTPHPTGSSTDEMSIGHVTSIFGLISQISWKDTNLSGARLFCWDAAPVISSRPYESWDVDNMACYSLPPVAVISCCFAYWRGELEFRFDIIASAFHVGKILLAYIPGTTSPVTLDVAKGSPYIVFDLDENRQFNFIVPFISNRPWWPRMKSSSFDYTYERAPGSIQMFVLAPLSSIAQVKNEATINVYMRAGPSFEVSIPCTPSIGLSFNTKFHRVPNVDYTVPIPGYTPFFTSWYNQFNSRYLTLFYKDVAGKVVQFEKMDPKAVYSVPDKITIIKDKEPVDVNFRVRYYRDGTNLLNVAAIVRVKGYYYDCVYCFSTSELAKRYAQTGDISGAIPYIKSGPWCEIKIGNNWLPWDGYGDIKFPKITNILGWEVITADMDQKSATTYSAAQLLPSPLSTGGGLWTFGECIRDLKDVCRRYNRYSDIRFDILANTCCAHAYSFAFPAMPQRLKLDIDKDNDTVDSRLRDGLIPVIASGYRFYRGGLRFKMLFKGLKRDDYIVVQFRPDHPAFDDNIIVKIDAKFHNYSDAIDYNYGCVYQGLVVNNCIEFEVPWYLTGALGLLQPIRFHPNSNSILREFSSLGHIYVFVRTANKDRERDVGVEVLYSLADDCRFSTFCGFPSVFFIDQIATTVPKTHETFLSEMGMEDDLKAKDRELQALNKKIKQMEKDRLESEKELEAKIIRSTDVNIAHTQSTVAFRSPVGPPVKLDNRNTSFFGAVKNAVTKAKDDFNKPLSKGVFGALTDAKETPKKMNEAIDDVKDIANELKDDIKTTTSGLREIFDMVKSFFMRTNGIKDKFGTLWDFARDWIDTLFSLLSQVVHMVLATTWATIIWAFSSILTLVFGFCNVIIAPVVKIWEKLSSFWSSKDDKEQKKEEEDKTVKKESPNEQNSGEAAADVTFSPNMGFTPLDDEDMDRTSIASIIMTAVISLLNVTVNPPKDFKDLTKGLFTNTRHVVMTANSITAFLRDNIVMFKRCFEWCVKQLDGENHLLSTLATEPEAIKTWAAEVIAFTTAPCRDIVKTNLDLITRAYALHASSQVLRQQLASNTHKLKNIQQLTKLCDAIDKLIGELIEHRVNSPARYEPFVMYIAGKPGIGKSFIADWLSIELLKDVGYKTVHDPIYTLISGMTHWNGCYHQPIVRIDDFCCVKGPEFHVTQMAQLFQIKTNSKLAPNMAHLDEKKMLYNPQICTITSNYEFPVAVEVVCEDAIHRRRNIVIVPCIKDQYKDVDMADIPDDVKKVYGHLTFYICNDPSDVKSMYSPGNVDLDSVHDPSTNGYEFNELYKILLARYKRYTTIETMNYKARLEQVTALYPKNNSLTISVDEYIANLKKISERPDEQAVKDACKLSEYYDKLISTGQMYQIRSQMGMTDEEKNDAVFCTDSIYYTSGFIDVDVEGEDKVTTLKVKPWINTVQTVIDKSTNKWLASCQERVCPHKAFMDYYPTSASSMLNLRFDPEYDSFYIQDLNGKHVPLPDNQCTVDGGKCGNCPYGSSVDFISYATHLLKYAPQLFVDINVKLLNMRMPPQFRKVYGALIGIIENKGNSVDTMLKSAQEIIQDKSKGLEVVNLKDGDKTKSFIVTCKDKVKSFFIRMWAKVKACSKFLKIIACIVGGVGLLFGAKKAKDYLEEKYNDGESTTPYLDEKGNSLISSLQATFYDIKGKICKPRAEYLQPEMVASGDAHQLKIAKTHRALIRTVKSQSGPGAATALMKKVVRNTLFLRSIDGRDNLTGRCLGIYNHTALVLTHYFERFEANGDNMIKVQYRDTSIDVALSSLKRTKFENTGYELVEFPFLAMFSKLIDYFPSAGPRFDFNPTCDLVTVTTDGFTSFREVRVTSNARAEVEGHEGVKPWTIVDGFRYGVGGAGTCGSVLISYTKSAPMIIGIHTAGCEGKAGISESLIKQTFLNKNGTYLEPLIPDMGSPDYDTARFQVQSVVIPIARLSNKEIVRIGEKSRIVPSEIAGVFPVLKQPVCLSTKDPRYPKGEISPLLAGCNKHGCIPGLFPESDVQDAIEDLTNKLKMNCPPVRNVESELSDLEAIQGLPLPGYERMEMLTSEGYPWLKHRPSSAKDKRWLFNWDESNTKLLSLDVGLEQALIQKTAQLEEGFIPPFVFVACLKDQRVDLEKAVKVGGARVFDVSPVDATILTRKYFIDFCAAYSEHRVASENTLGINVNGPEWSNLYDTLTSHSPFILDGDYSNYGPGLPHQLLRGSFSVIRNWYKYNGCSDTSDVARQALCESICNSYTIAHDLLYQRLAGLPSGCCITTPLNSVTNSLFMRVVFLGLARELSPEHFSLKAFNSKVIIYHNGDDIIMSVSPDIISWFNNKAISQYLARYGIKFTAADKGSEVVPFKSIREVQYLKCKFVQHPNCPSRQMAQLDWASVVDTANWIWKCENERDASIQNSEQAVRLAYGHGEVVLSEIRRKIIQAWSDIGVFVSLPTWKQLDHQIWFQLKPIKIKEDEKEVYLSWNRL